MPHLEPIFETMESPRPTHSGDLARLLADCAEGDAEAFDRLMPLVYGDLRRIAHRQLGQERPDHTLSTTDVVHEAYVQLVDHATATWQDRAHFFAAASRVIRHVLIDYARTMAATKRGGGAIRIPLREELDGHEPDTVELLALDEALEELAAHDPALERVVVLRFFGGMTMPDTAAALGISLRTAERQWRRARAYLYRALKS